MMCVPSAGPAGPGNLMALALVAALARAAAAEDLQALLDRMRDLSAVQTVYRDGVPHTDKQGRLLMEYDPDRSFFQIGVCLNAHADGRWLDAHFDHSVGFQTSDVCEAVTAFSTFERR